MTQNRKEPDDITNYFDRLMDGHLGTKSFFNFDAYVCTHSGDKHRYLIQEFKHGLDWINEAVEWALGDLACDFPGKVSVWVIHKLGSGLLLFASYPSKVFDVITEKQYQEHLDKWERGN